jgi:hypothetical protein
VHVAPACARSREGSNHFGSYVRSLFLHFCKRLFPELELMTSWSHGNRTQQELQQYTAKNSSCIEHIDQHGKLCSIADLLLKKCIRTEYSVLELMLDCCWLLSERQQQQQQQPSLLVPNKLG